MPTTPEGTTGRRLALVIATGSYADPTLSKLRAPGRDATDLAAVLGDAALGGFEVETVLDASAEALRRGVAHFCAQIGPSDLALVYLSCHGVLDDRGRLYYATTDTDRSLLAATAVSSAWLNEQLEDSRGRRQILVLDCCHSGAFAKGAKGESTLALGRRFEGRGRVVLTGSRGTEYSFEHDHVVGDGVSSVFTGSLVEGLRSGDADRDGDGLVTVNELYEHVYDAVRAKEARQTPTLWTYGVEGDLLVARSPKGTTIKSPPSSAPPPSPPADPPGTPGLSPGRPRFPRRRRAVALTAVAAATVLLAVLLLLGGGEKKAAAPVTPGSLPAPGSPRAIVAGEGAIWVARYQDEKVDWIDLASSDTESIGVGPWPTKIAAGEGSAWVASWDGWTLERVVPPPPASYNGVTLKKCECKVAKLVLAEGKLWVGSAMRHAIVSFDPKTGEQISTPYSPGPGFGGVFAVGDGAVWAVGYDESETQAWVSRTDLDLNGSSRDRFPLPDAGEHLDAVAYGHGTLWIADATDGRNTVSAFDPDSGEVVKDFKIPNGVTSDDLAVAEDAVLVWDPDGGVLTNIDPEGMEIAGAETIDGFADEPVNHEWSDLAAAEGLAWITDPAQGKVLKETY